MTSVNSVTDWLSLVCMVALDAFLFSQGVEGSLCGNLTELFLQIPENAPAFTEQSDSDPTGVRVLPGRWTTPAPGEH